MLTPSEIIPEPDSQLPGNRMGNVLFPSRRNRVCNQKLDPEMAEKNIFMIGPTGAGKIELRFAAARRSAYSKRYHECLKFCAHESSAAGAAGAPGKLSLWHGLVVNELPVSAWQSGKFLLRQA